jgi:hypothetical protein
MTMNKAGCMSGKQAGLLFNELVNEMSTELKTISSGRNKEEYTPAERRMYIRSVFALIEAIIFVMKQMALSFHPGPDCDTISDADRVFAQEQVYKLTESGDIQVHRNKITLESNIRFAFKLFARAGYISTDLDVSGAEWQALKRAIKLRDRITHPKAISDLTISNEEFNDVFTSFGWLTISFVKQFTEIANKALVTEKARGANENLDYQI